VILVDVNLLVYSIDAGNRFHAETRTWWDNVLSSEQKVGLCLPSILGFLRLATNPRIFESPLAVHDAIGRIEGWLDQPRTTLLLPTTRHWKILRGLLESLGLAANLTTDAHLAAYAIEHGYELYSNDTDFGRFPDLRWVNPLT